MSTPTFDTRLAATLALQVAEQIGKAILEERLQPGERIREVELATAFTVSRATIREALRILQQRGLVRIVPQRGATVTQLSLAELQNLFEIRSVLLGLASRRAARQFQAPQRARLQQGLAALRQAQGDPEAYIAASRQMVRLLVELSGNPQLGQIIQEYAERIGRYVRRGLSDPRRHKLSLQTWRELVEAVCARDEVAAETIHRRLADDNRDAAMALIVAQSEPSLQVAPAARKPRRARPVPAGPAATTRIL